MTAVVKKYGRWNESCNWQLESKKEKELPEENYNGIGDLLPRSALAFCRSSPMNRSWVFFVVLRTQFMPTVFSTGTEVFLCYCLWFDSITSLTTD